MNLKLLALIAGCTFNMIGFHYLADNKVYMSISIFLMAGTMFIISFTEKDGND